MRFRDQVALTLPALVLRLVLAVVFLWAGFGKFMTTTTVTGDDAARLANIGVPLSAVQPEVPEPAEPEPVEPLNEIPDPEADPEAEPDLETDADQTNPEEDSFTPEDEQRLQEILDEAKRRAEEAKNETKEDAADLIEETLDTPPVPQPEPGNPDTLGMGAPAVVFRSVQNSTEPAAASDYPNPMNARAVYGIGLLLNKCANPGLTEDSQPIKPILPKWAGTGSTARYLSIAAGVTEIGAGLLLLLGFLTRLSALSTLIVMLVALWTTQFGPAAVQSSDAILGFIPNHGDVWNASSYTTLFLQLAMTAMSIAVFFLGSGPIGVDRVLFGASRRDKYIHGDPKSAQPASPERDPFDRSPNPTP